MTTKISAFIDPETLMDNLVSEASIISGRRENHFPKDIADRERNGIFVDVFSDTAL